MKEKFYFFGDVPVTKPEEDKFSVEYQVNTLERIIVSLLDRQEAFNIGIYGKWGVGKTSVINLFKKRIKSSDRLKNKIEIAVFNAWKYSGDSLMRQFLLFLDGEKGLNTKLEVIEELEKTVQTTTSKPKLNKWYLSGTVVLALIIFLLLNATAQNTLIQAVISLLIVVLYPTYEFLKQKSIRKVTVDETKHRIDKPDQFERKFRQIIEKAQANGKKTIIVIDELDRCPADKVIEMLGIVKNFLDMENCIYIIPCDDAAIKKHLNKVMGYDNGREGDEFLKKFFQIIIWVPPYIDEDLFTYTHELAEKAGFSNSVEEVIIRAFWESPRQIKQFLNNLNALRIQAEEKEEKGLLKKGVITNNLSFLTKIEAIRERWPFIYEKTIKDENYLKILESSMFGRKIEGISKEKQADIEIELNEDAELKSFLYSTIDIQTPDITPFLKLGQPEYTLTLEDGELTSLLSIVSDPITFRERFLKTEKKTQYVNTLLSFIKRRGMSGYYGDVFNATRALIEIYQEIADKKLRETVANRVAEVLGLIQIKPKLEHINYAKTFGLLKDAEKSRAEEVLLHLADLVKIPKSAT